MEVTWAEAWEIVETALTLEQPLIFRLIFLFHLGLFCVPRPIALHHLPDLESLQHSSFPLQQQTGHQQSY